MLVIESDDMTFHLLSYHLSKCEMKQKKFLDRYLTKNEFLDINLKMT